MVRLARRRVKLLAVISVWLAVPLVYLLVLLPPARGYEISLYSSLPAAVWVLTVLGLFVAQSGLLLMAFGTPRESRSRTWVVFVSVTVVILVTLLLLPYLRGYPLYGRADVLTHVGFIRSIDAYGTISPPDVYPQDIYPNIHLLVMTLWYATGVDALHVINAVPPVVTALSVGSLWLLLEEVFDDRRKTLAAMALAVLPLGFSGHVNPSPFAQSVILVPLVIYLFLRARRTGDVSYRAAMSIALISLVLYHPLTTLFVIVVIGVYGVINQLDLFEEAFGGPSLAGYITVSAFATWYLQFAGIVFKFREIFEMFVATTEDSASTFESYSETVNETSPALIDVVRIGVFKYGPSAIIVALMGAYVVLAMYLKRRGRLELNSYSAALTAAALGFTGAAAAFFVQDFTVNYGRPLVFARYLAVVPAGLLLYHAGSYLRSNGRLSGIVKAGVHLTLLLLVVLSVFTVYYSPLESRENHQVTRMEFEGSEWVFEHSGEEGIRVSTLGWSAERYHDARYGVWNETAPQIAAEDGAPAHFNYTRYPYLGDSYQSDTNLGITRLGRIVFPAKFPDYREQWSFTPEDFARLEHDPTVDRTYDNGEFDGYRITATGDGVTNGTTVDAAVETRATPT